VLDAAIQLIEERGIDGTSMDAIAGASGVSKATIYKHWAPKDALALEMLDHLHALDNWKNAPSDDVIADITAVLARRPSTRTANLRARIMPHLMAYAARHEEFHKVWRARLLEPTLTELTRLLHRAIAEGRLPLGFDCRVGVALLLGPMLYSWMSGLAGATLPADLPSQIVHTFWQAHGLPTAPRSQRRQRRK